MTGEGIREVEDARRAHSVVIVGAGAAGMALAGRLSSVGTIDFLVLERGRNVDAERLGAQAVGAEALKFVCFDAELREARYDGARALWLVATADGQEHTAELLVLAGQLAPDAVVVGRWGAQLRRAQVMSEDAQRSEVARSGFPNLFIVECADDALVEHVIECRDAMIARGEAEIELDLSMGQNARGAAPRALRLSDYRFRSPLPGLRAQARRQKAPAGLVERASASALRSFLTLTFRALMGEPFPPWFQRGVVTALSLATMGVGGVTQEKLTLAGVRTRAIRPKEDAEKGAILYLHGGGFVAGGAYSHRAITTRLARETKMAVFVPDYRLAPENRFPAAHVDCVAAYKALLDKGYAAEQIVVMGDSAGGRLTIDVATRLKEKGVALPAGLAMISPAILEVEERDRSTARRGFDPMIRRGWMRQILRWARPEDQPLEHRPMHADLAGLPPILIQAGRDEFLLPDSFALAERAASAGVSCELVVFERRWHVFHLQASLLASARAAVRELSAFARSRVNAE